jgi:hypothetical protein
LLPDDQAAEFRALWDEFEDRQTADARFAHAIDRCQAMLLNCLSKGVTWSRHHVRLDQIRRAQRAHRRGLGGVVDTHEPPARRSRAGRARLGIADQCLRCSSARSTRVTTSTRFMVFDAAGQEVARRQIEHQQILPGPGWVEHDPIEIAARVDEVIAGGAPNGWTDRTRSGRHRHHQPARDHSRLGSADRPAVAQRHRLAGHANGRTRRDVDAAARTAHRARPGFHRPPTSPH